MALPNFSDTASATFASVETVPFAPVKSPPCPGSIMIFDNTFFWQNAENKKLFADKIMNRRIIFFIMAVTCKNEISKLKSFLFFLLYHFQESFCWPGAGLIIAVL